MQTYWQCGTVWLLIGTWQIDYSNSLAGIVKTQWVLYILCINHNAHVERCMMYIYTMYARSEDVHNWISTTFQKENIMGLNTSHCIYGHTKQKALHPVRSAKLSCLGPRQYYGGGPHGNPRCRRSFFAQSDFLVFPDVFSHDMLCFQYTFYACRTTTYFASFFASHTCHIQNVCFLIDLFHPSLTLPKPRQEIGTPVSVSKVDY